jgi:hypothetical protein
VKDGKVVEHWGVMQEEVPASQLLVAIRCSCLCDFGAERRRGTRRSIAEVGLQPSARRSGFSRVGRQPRRLSSSHGMKTL